MHLCALPAWILVQMQNIERTWQQGQDLCTWDIEYLGRSIFAGENGFFDIVVPLSYNLRLRQERLVCFSLFVVRY